MENLNYFIVIVTVITLMVNFIRIIKFVVYFMASVINSLNKKPLLLAVICVWYTLLVGRDSVF